MGGKRKGRGRRAVIDASAKVAMLAALREGRRLDEVAASYGVTLQAFYSARRRDPVFAAGWGDAHSISAEAERRRAGEAEAPEAAAAGADAGGDSGAGAGAGVRIVSNNQRILQRRKMRHVRFDARRKGVFLAAFERCCDLIAAAAEAGVCERTVYYHLKRDPAFAEAFQAALEAGYSRLEAEAVRGRLEAQERLRSAAAEARAKGEAPELAGEGLEFDRAMTLLARWDRGGGRLGRRQVGPGRRERWSFEEAIELLDRKLRSLGVARGVLPPETGG